MGMLMSVNRQENGMLNSIVCGNCVDVMKKIPDETVDLVVTSPPYDNLRTYNGYSFDFENIAQQLLRVLKPGGVVVWVVGDGTEKGSETGTSFRQALHFKDIGFNLHDTMIYQKHNFSNPSRTRYHQIFEYMFILSKGKPKTFNPIKDRKNVYGGKVGSWGKNTVRQPDGSFKENKRKTNSEYGMRYNIWRIITHNKKAKHPAMFPESLAEDHILSWSNEGDVVLDPMVGSGTTCKMAAKNNRAYIGIDISEEYCELARERISGSS